MKVSELIEELQKFEGEQEVHFVYNYGDHSRTDVAPKVREVGEEGVRRSEYHEMDAIDEEDPASYVVTLRA